MSTPPTGWYPDPAGSELYRWWDGDEWTDALSPTAQAPAPRHASPAGPAGETDRDGSGGSVETLDFGRARSFARPVAVLVVVALLAVTVLGVGTALLGPGSTRTSETPTADPTSVGTPGPSIGGSPARPSLPPGSVDERTGTARIGEAEMNLPTEPYVVGDAFALESFFDAGFAANAPVQVPKKGTPGWYSTVALLHAPADRVDGNPEQTSRQAMAVMTRWLFGSSTDVTLKATRRTFTTVAGRPALRAEAEAWYAIPGLTSTHDDVTLVVMGMPDGSYVAAVSSIPDDAPALHRTLAQESLDSLIVR